MDELTQDPTPTVETPAVVTPAKLVTKEAKASRRQSRDELTIPDPTPAAAAAAIAEATLPTPAERAAAVYREPGVAVTLANAGLQIPSNMSDEEIFGYLQRGRVLIPAQIRSQMGL